MSDISAQVSALELRIARQYASRTEVEELAEKLETTRTATIQLESSLEGIKTNLKEVKNSIDKLFYTVIGAVFVAAVLQLVRW